jgi:hypothetical protein
MKKLLLNSRVQEFINLMTGIYTLAGIMVLFIAGDSEELREHMWLWVSTLSTLLTFLIYNIWVSLELDAQRLNNKF